MSVDLWVLFQIRSQKQTFREILAFLIVVQSPPSTLHPEFHNSPGQLRAQSSHLKKLIVILNHLTEELKILKFVFGIFYYTQILNE